MPSWDSLTPALTGYPATTAHLANTFFTTPASTVALTRGTAPRAAVGMALRPGAPESGDAFPNFRNDEPFHWQNQFSADSRYAGLQQSSPAPWGDVAAYLDILKRDSVSFAGKDILVFQENLKACQEDTIADPKVAAALDDVLCQALNARPNPYTMGTHGIVRSICSTPAMQTAANTILEWLKAPV